MTIHVSGVISASEIKTQYESNADTNEYDDAEQTKLTGCESGSTADQTGAQIKTAYEGQSNAYTDTKNTKLAGIATNATKYPDTGEQAFLDADHTKLNGIDTGAKDDQTGAEIKAAYEAEANAYTDTKNTKLAGIATAATKYPDTGEQAFLDADHTKLDGLVAIPSGLISMWHGTLANIPSGWVLCDGTNSTPDLRDKFVRGATAAANPGATGGADTHVLSVAELPSHTHTISMNNGAPGGTVTRSCGNVAAEQQTPASGATGSGTAHNNMPAYYAVAYIMKV